MKKICIIVMTLFIGGLTPVADVQARALVRVKAIGSSPRGQYVAFEEFGYQHGRTKPYSKIRIMNVWKSEYVDIPVQVIGKKRGEQLISVREKAKDLALDKLKKFNIAI